MSNLLPSDVFFQAPNVPKPVSGRGSAPDPAAGAYDAPPDPLVGWWGGQPLPIDLFLGPQEKFVATPEYDVQATYTDSRRNKRHNTLVHR